MLGAGGEPNVTLFVWQVTKLSLAPDPVPFRPPYLLARVWKENRSPVAFRQGMRAMKRLHARAYES